MIFIFAAKGEGAFLVEKGDAPERLKVSDKTNFTEMNLASSRNHRSPKMHRIIEDFGFRQEIQRGSVGLKIGLIAQQICGFVHSSFTAHKILGHLRAADYSRRSRRKNDRSFRRSARLQFSTTCRITTASVATNGVAHEEVLLRLKPILSEFGRLE